MPAESQHACWQAGDEERVSNPGQEQTTEQPSGRKAVTQHLQILQAPVAHNRNWSYIHQMASALPQPGTAYPIELGSSFASTSSPDDGGLYLLRYDFKPASAGRTGEGSLRLDRESRQVSFLCPARTASSVSKQRKCYKLTLQRSCFARTGTAGAFLQAAPAAVQAWTQCC